MVAGDVRRKVKGSRFLWQYGEKWMTEQRQEKLSWLHGHQPVLDAKGAGERYLEPTVQRTEPS
ncbi:transposase [Erwinia tracheiphila PSU-1]|nr:transposase [Erwinia tracheiphila PSU-1]